MTGENTIMSDVAMVWRDMQQGDLAAVLAIAARVHPDYPESPAVFSERLHLFAAGCRVAVDARDAVHGYAITHPAMLGHPPALNSLLLHLPPQADCLYLHDVAILPTVRQFGLGARLVALIEQHARALQVGYAALVAVNNSGDYWRRHGFSDYAGTDAALRKKIASYDDSAQYLVLALP